MYVLLSEMTVYVCNFEALDTENTSIETEVETFFLRVVFLPYSGCITPSNNVSFAEMP